MTILPSQLMSDATRTEQCLTSVFGKTADATAPRLMEAMAYSALNGGKRIRAALVLGAARLAIATAKPDLSDVEEGFGDEGQGSLRVAAAFECLHAYSLIHDDLPAMDDADTRRGKPSCHVAFDEATAILAGDALQSLAFELLADPLTHADPGVRASLVVELASASGVNGMAGGQMLDLKAETRALDMDETKVMQAMKTGALIRAAVRSGGLVGGADPALMTGLDTYAVKIGRAFQIADDILDRQASAEDLGKPAGRDAEAGKASFVDFLGMDGAIDEAAKLAREAGEALHATTSYSTPELDYLLELASFIIRREF